MPPSPEQVFLAKGRPKGSSVSGTWDTYSVPRELEELMELIVLHPETPYRHKTDLIRDALFHRCYQVAERLDPTGDMTAVLDEITS